LIFARNTTGNDGEEETEGERPTRHSTEDEE
jgi:hypothetical protein